MLQPGSFVGTFDLNSQTGVMSVLASIRATNIPAAEKNELRDLVFLYTKGGGDASVRISLEQKLAAHQVIPVASRGGASAGPVLPFGSYRPTPLFKTASVSTPTPTYTPPPMPIPVLITVVPAPVVELVAPVPIPQPVSVPIPDIQVPVIAAPQAEPVSVAIPVLENIPTPMVASLVEVNYLERIREIKTAVNSKVGNPVNLVDINNEVGREYMNALLEAMKKLSSGSVSGMAPAMQRLEQSFLAVEVALANQTPIIPQAVVPVIVPESVPQPVPIPVDVSQTPELAPELVSDFETQVRAKVPDHLIPLVEMPDLVTFSPVPSTPVEEKSGYELQTAAPKTAPSLADQQKILTPYDLPDAASLETGAAGDVYTTKEIDNGLQQLLSDWSLFKKSGLFGTGPKGREHPLYKKIADLQISLILAGRFEGSTQEIRQSITDYMNGWRYEQGIVYQPGETFDRYLRRVIRHIIDLQKKHAHA